MDLSGKGQNTLNAPANEAVRTLIHPYVSQLKAILVFNVVSA